ncbi:intermembrane transport protein PqiB [Telmatospirillum siberiense]|uniref:Mammalian cell entry protein n=1 Tax=Telmatospirillum siberiense TaxID=382514 RepID=A0A2N3PXF4_9PROT|nr:MlaD family protein [Telmatospirillum siberiense]PKU25086.1 mammalian cell entry protein [Telmatospirillum siberiense]
MIDSPNPPFHALPEPVIEPPRRWRFSMVWIIPLLAAVIGLSLVVQAIMQRGPTITVTFSSAEGIEPGKTKVKFKDVDIGEVKTVRLSQDRARVVVTIELVKEAGQLAVADSRFWVVRPRFAGSGVSGLGTLLSGSYIGVDAGHSSDDRTDFVGLDTPPVVASDVPGHRFKLLAEDIGSVDMGSPVYFRRIEVGHVESFTLEPDGHRIALGVFVKSPYDRFVTTETRFWHASGVDLRLDSAGVRLETQSLASILMGGIAFETAGSTDQPAQDGAVFSLAASHADAMKTPDGEPEAVVMRFRQSVRGLAVGAPVDFRGIEIGVVRSIGLTFDPDAGDFSAPVMVDIYPDRLAPQAVMKSTDRKFRASRLAELVRRGLRAQLRTGSFLTGQLYVAADFFPDAPGVRFDAGAQPMELPTVPSDMQELQQQVQSILRKLDKVPFDTLGQDAHHALVSVNTTLKRIDTLVGRTDSDILPEIRDSLQEVRRTMETTRASLAGDSPLQQDTRQALRGVAEATRSLKALSDSLNRHPESLVRGRKGEDQ